VGGEAREEYVRGEERRRRRSMGEWFWTEAWDPRMPDFVFSPPRWQSSLTTRTSVGGVITIAAIYMFF